MATIPADIRELEAERLSALYKANTALTQTAFAKAFGLSSEAMVWQYLKGHRPLNLQAAAQFAAGLGVPLRAFSPRLDAEFRQIARQIQPKPSVAQTHVLRERAPRDPAWPFELVDRAKLIALAAEDLLRIEGAMLSTAALLGLSIQKEQSAAG